VQNGQEDNLYEKLQTSGQRALFNNLKLDREVEGMTFESSEEPASYSGYQDRKLQLALSIDETVKRVKLDGWRGHKPKEQRIKEALFTLLQNDEDVERLFDIIYRQPEY